MARPSKLNEELIEAFGEKIKKGLPIVYVCDALLVSDTTYYNWMEQGEKDFRNDVDSLYSEFFGTIKKSYAEYIEDSRDVIQSGALGWQGRAWWLERTNSKFMPKQQIQADEDGKVVVNIGGKVKDVIKK